MERAVVLAAGTGSRLSRNGPAPKPLKLIGGTPLLVRVLRTLQDEGIREAVIVLGHDGELIRKRLVEEPSIGLKLTFVHNECFHLKNGVSLLAAREHIVEGTLLTMADHLYSPEVVRRLQHANLPPGACALAVDYDCDRCFDIDDATKVDVERGRISRIGKEINGYNALDTGVFRIGPALIDALDEVLERRGDVSLSDGVLALAKQGNFYATDVGDARWIDVDTPAALERAEAMIRVFGDGLGDEPAESVTRIAPESVELFAPSWVRAAQPYREDHFEVAAQRDDVARLMSNESPFPPSQRVLDAIIGAAAGSNRYPMSPALLREKLAKRDSLTSEHVLLGAGSTELIDVIIRSFVSPGEEVVISVPTFSMYEARTRTAGGVPVLVPLAEDGAVDMGGVIGSINERTKVVFLCSPNNPTGNLLDEAMLRRVLRLGLPTVIDEAYWEFANEPSSASHLVAEFPNAIILRTFSKAFGLAGLRIGYALAHPVVIRILARVKVPWNVSAIALAAAGAALDDMAEQERRLTLMREGRRYLERELSSMPGVSIFPSEGNFVLVDIRRTGCGVTDVVDGMLARGVFVRTLATHHAGGSLLRITVGSRRDNERCVDALKDVLRSPSLAAETPRAPNVAPAKAEVQA